MRIAYLAPYQGPDLLRYRPVVLNRSLAIGAKVELVARALRAHSHELEVLSQGEVIENTGTLYTTFRESHPFDEDVPVYYASTWPVKRLNALWSTLRTLELFLRRHREKPFDAAIIWNLKLPQLVCAHYALLRLKIPAILEYEDDAFVEVSGQPRKLPAAYRLYSRQVLNRISGCLACSPRLLDTLTAGIPKLLVRGIAGSDILAATSQNVASKKPWVLFAGSHHKQYGLLALINAWKDLHLSGWQLHITGEGPETASARPLAADCPTIRFHGLVSRSDLVKLMCSSRICINPHETSRTPGNVFAFKIIEYLAAGAHVLTTPMGPIEPDLENGITYIPDNSPASIARALKDLIEQSRFGSTAAHAALQRYGIAPVSNAINLFLNQVMSRQHKFQSFDTVQPSPICGVSSPHV